MSTKDLCDNEAKAKLRDLAEDIKFTMMVTALDLKPLNAIPMTTKKVDEQGNIWFLSAADSDHNKHIENDERVQLIYSDPSDMRYLSVYGEAVITKNRKILAELYDKKSDVWFDGLEDPRLTAIQFYPREAYYWEYEKQ
ncbi:pyridoxamine 5'-phosphate oxidase family protein [Aquimarina intermedia]|uniref:General stress protein 26 n=1 Tax=Aquimarina intermedia TaxID=350814 RepID=A0A5S5CC60_9FLAO|nr:pyridoxamine 5'-phosphate oxidase family protein [Aquimarina intermedia]TYP75926.1 general stress protein 26 [Aquimarina intermedia]